MGVGTFHCQCPGFFFPKLELYFRELDDTSSNRDPILHSIFLCSVSRRISAAESNPKSTMMSNPSATPDHQTILLLTHARTASHVLERMLSKQQALYGSHFYQAGRIQRRDLLKAGPLHTTDPAVQADLLKLLNDGHEQFEGFVADAKQQGKTAFVHTQPHAMISPQVASDYVYGPSSSDEATTAAATTPDWLVGPPGRTHTNITVLPDDVFLRPGTTLIINFRHPLLIVDGIARGMRDLPAFQVGNEWRPLVRLGGNVHWQRVMYDWSRSRGARPILLDADDYLGPDNRALMQRVCDLVPGFDAEDVIYSWPKATADELAAMPEALRQSQETISGSEGVMQGYDSRGRSLEAEVAKWTERYGVEEAGFLREMVEGAMADYEYLRERRLRVDGGDGSSR